MIDKVVPPARETMHEYSSTHLRLQKKTRWTRPQPIKKGKVTPVHTKAGKSNTNEKTKNRNGNDELQNDDGFTTSKWIAFFFRVDFPLFSDAVMREYRIYNHLNVNPIVFGPSVLVYVVLIVCCAGLMGLDGTKSLHVFIISLVYLSHLMFSILFLFDITRCSL